MSITAKSEVTQLAVILVDRDTSALFKQIVQCTAHFYIRINAVQVTSSVNKMHSQVTDIVFMF